MIASFAEKNKLKAVGSNQVLDCAKLGFASKLTVTQCRRSMRCRSRSGQRLGYLAVLQVGRFRGGAEVGRGWAERKCTKRLRDLEADGFEKGFRYENC